MKPLPLIIACSTALTCVVACSRAEAQIIKPPAQFRGDAVVTVRFVDPEAVPPLCKTLGAALGFAPARGAYFEACEGGNTLIMPNPCLWPNGSDYRDLLCHELAHANGWPSDHSNQNPRGE